MLHLADLWPRSVSFTELPFSRPKPAESRRSSRARLALSAGANVCGATRIPHFKTCCGAPAYLAAKQLAPSAEEPQRVEPSDDTLVREPLLCLIASRAAGPW